MKTFVNTANKGTLNLRAEPSASAKVLARIPYGTEIEAEFTNSKWSKVEYNGKIGYVMSEFLGDKTSVTKESLQKIYTSLKETLKIIEEVLK
jgi:uncharacterized protein YgiM (DUF1202 family)